VSAVFSPPWRLQFPEEFMTKRSLSYPALVVAALVAIAVAAGCSSKNDNHVTNPGGGGNPSFNSGVQGVGAVFNQTFPVVGVVNYYCVVHGAAMTGSVAIVAGAPDSLVNVAVGSGGANFSPANVTLRPNGTVHWTWAGSNHSVTSGNPPAATRMAPMGATGH
jgi:plastocyanin